MKQKTWPARLAAGTLVIVALAGVALASGQQGTQADPLVTLSYLTDKATPEILAQVDNKLSQRESELALQLGKVVDGYVQSVEDKLAGGSGSTVGGGQAAFTVVTLAQGQTLVGTAACELLLRSGTATCISETAPGLVDMTSGSTLANGAALAQNHLYLATVDGRGVKAGSAVTIMVRGGYTIQ